MDTLQELEKFNEIENTTCRNYLELSKCILKRSRKNIINIYQLNIRSLNKNFDEFLISINDFVKDLDVIILTETWKVANIDCFKIQNFDVYYNNSNFNQNDGVVVYIRSDIQHRVEVVDNYEMKFLKVTFNINDKQVILSAIYRPPSNDTATFLIYLQEYLNNSYNNAEIGIIAGDININTAAINDFSLEYLHLLNVNGFIYNLNEYTRVTDNSASCIDHFFIKSTNNFTFDYKTFITEDDLSDHYPITLQFSFKNESVLEGSNNKRVVHKLNYTKLKAELQTASWDNVTSCTDINIATNEFYKVVNKAINKAKFKKVITHKDIKIKPWITQGLVQSIRQRVKMYGRVKNNPNNVLLKEDYKKYRNTLHNLIKITKDEYYAFEISRAGSNAKEVGKL